MEPPGEFDYCPWLFWRAPDDVREAHAAWLDTLRERLQANEGELEVGDRVYISPLAAVFPRRLRMGDRCYIAAHAYVTEDVVTGDDCTLNPFVTVRGKVELGDAVRIGAHTSILGFNHGTDPDRPVHRQPLTSRGIRIGDDVWIGSNAVVLDGVTIGDHCVIGAGAVVTRDLPAWSIAAGNPARVIRDRRDDRRQGRRNDDLAVRLAEFAERAREQATAVLERCRRAPGSAPDLPGGTAFVPVPGGKPTVRAWCDAVEVADLLLGTAPPGTSGDEVAEYLRGLQDPATGLVPEYGEEHPGLHHGAAAYHILCVGYALSLLDSGFVHPIRAVQDMSAPELLDALEALPWNGRAWSAGAFVDAIGTAYRHNLLDFDLRAPSTEALFGWLFTRADPVHGMWGTPDRTHGLHQVVNGFYRLTRGTFAQFGLPLPYPERAIDTLLAHARDGRYFGPNRGTACDVLDVIHPLWLCAKQTSYRRDEGEEWARRQLGRALSRWQDSAGFSFTLEPGPGSSHTPGLQGTEMWLAIIWLLADHLGHSDALGYRPRGVHRPEPAAGL